MRYKLQANFTYVCGKQRNVGETAAFLDLLKPELSMDPFFCDPIQPNRSAD